MLTDWTQSHGGRYKSDRRLIQERRHSRFGFPSTDTQRQSKADRQMTGGLFRFYRIPVLAENRLGPELIRRHAYDLTAHLATGHSRLTTQLRRIQFSIDLGSQRDLSMGSGLIRPFYCEGLSPAHAATQQVPHVAGELIGILHRSALNGRF
jgi:hypothetical protein